MSLKEADSRIKINKLPEDSGWRFFDNEQGRANNILWNHTKINGLHMEMLGEDLGHINNDYVDYLLLYDKSFPLIVLEVKRAGLHPLVGLAHAMVVESMELIKVFERKIKEWVMEA